VGEEGQESLDYGVCMKLRSGESKWGCILGKKIFLSIMHLGIRFHIYGWYNVVVVMGKSGVDWVACAFNPLDLIKLAFIL